MPRVIQISILKSFSEFPMKLFWAVIQLLKSTALPAPIRLIHTRYTDGETVLRTARDVHDIWRDIARTIDMKSDMNRKWYWLIYSIKSSRCDYSNRLSQTKISTIHEKESLRGRYATWNEVEIVCAQQEDLYVSIHDRRASKHHRAAWVHDTIWKVNHEGPIESKGELSDKREQLLSDVERMIVSSTTWKSWKRRIADNNAHLAICSASRSHQQLRVRPSHFVQQNEAWWLDKRVFSRSDRN